MITTYKVMLKPNKGQLVQLIKSVGTSRFVYNWALNEQLENYKSGGKFINDGDLRKKLTQLKQTPEFEWLYEVSNNIGKQSVKDLCKAYKRFFDIQKNPKTKGYSQKTIERSKRLGKNLTSYDLQGHPKFKSKKNSTMSFYNDPVMMLVKNNKVLLESVGWVKLNESSIPDRLSQKDNSIKYYNPIIS